MHLSEQLGHLTYCTNIHAAEHWPDVAAGLRAHLPAIKAQVSPQHPLGVGLRVAASAAQSLQDPDTLHELRELLGDDYYVFTLNGFPYGTFHGQPVKDGAYAPDWSEPARLDYTNQLADQLAALLPDGMTGSVSTVPLSYKPWLAGDANRAQREARIVQHLVAHVAHLMALGDRTGKRVVLALEPEPTCALETIDETVRYFSEVLFGEAAVAQLAQVSGRATGECADALRGHLGVCYDVCHAAVEFEDPRASVEALRAAGIEIAKLQLSSALKLEGVTRQTARALEPFDEPVYLHQTISRRGDSLRRFADLGEAFESLDEEEGGEWRSHFHVPIFLERMEHFATTQSFLRDILALHRESPISAHLEVETYTWDVLPARYRELDLASAIARELNWVRDALEPARA